jgi:hypothetical protein
VAIAVEITSGSTSAHPAQRTSATRLNSIYRAERQRRQHDEGVAETAAGPTTIRQSARSRHQASRRAVDE